MFRPFMDWVVRHDDSMWLSIYWPLLLPVAPLISFVLWMADAEPFPDALAADGEGK